MTNSDYQLTSAISDSLLTLCLKYQVIPLEEKDDSLVIACDSKLTAQQETTLQFALNKQIKQVIWTSVKLEQVRQKLMSDRTHHRLNQPSLSKVKEEEGSYHAEQDDEHVAKFINQTLDIAFQRRASDIHFEPYADCYRIRFRIDGVLQELMESPSILATRLAARLKILGQLNIAERRLPQDGQITIEHHQRNYALRISTLPVVEGEKVVLRIVDAGHQPLDIAKLGLSEQQQKDYLAALSSPQGLILVTGPTGSGKTVTLYSGLTLLNQSSTNICSVEDPVEVPIKGINQVQVNPKIGLLFTSALRAFLRQDPDVIMIGEIRDRETAEIAVEAAQTGHLVLSTLHTNSTIETLLRLEQIGIPDYQVIASLKLVIAQRLIRCLCPHCKQQDDELVTIKLPYWQGQIRNCLPKGCEHCLNGYYGRTGLYEMLVITPDIKQAVLNKMDVVQLQQLLLNQGMEPLLLAGIRLVEQGITSLSEVYRVVGSVSDSPQVMSIGGEQ